MTIGVGVASDGAGMTPGFGMDGDGVASDGAGTTLGSGIDGAGAALASEDSDSDSVALVILVLDMQDFMAHIMEDFMVEVDLIEESL